MIGIMLTKRHRRQTTIISPFGKQALFKATPTHTQQHSFMRENGIFTTAPLRNGNNHSSGTNC